MIRHHIGPIGERNSQIVQNLTKEAIPNIGSFEWQTSCFTFGDNHSIIVKESSQDAINDAVIGESDYFTVLGVHFLTPNASSTWSIWDPQNAIYWEDTTLHAYKNYTLSLNYEGIHKSLDVPDPMKTNCNNLPYVCSGIHSADDVFTTTWLPKNSFTQTDLQVSAGNRTE